jgi:hypothetical protein
MKEIGRTGDGCYIVEMTQDEVLAYDRLAQVMEGATVWKARERRNHDDYDMTTALDCVTAFASIVGILNDVGQQVGEALRILTTKRNKEEQ